MKAPADTSTTILSSTPEPEAKPEAPKPEAPQGAPEKYADWKAPENYKLLPELVEAVNPLFKELNLTQDQGQKLVDWYSQRAIAESRRTGEIVAEMRQGWRDQLKADPELGGRIDSIKANVGKALSVAFGGDAAKMNDFRQAMDLTGAGDHPAVIRFISKLADMVNEGTFVAPGGMSPEAHGRPNGAAKPTAAQALYPNLPTSAR